MKIILLFLLLLPAVYATGFGVSPPSITKSPEVLHVVNGQSESMNVSIETQGDVAVSSYSLHIPPKQSQKVRVEGNGNGTLVLKTEAGFLSPSVTVPVYVEESTSFQWWPLVALNIVGLVVAVVLWKKGIF